MSDYLFIIFALVVVYATTAGRRFGQLSVISLFIYAQAVMAVGTLPVLDPDIAADQTHCVLLISTIAILVVFAIFYGLIILREPRNLYDPAVDFSYPKRATIFLIIISIVISTLYYASVGYLAFFESIQALANDTGEDLAGLRLESYAGSQYFFPGYVNQFKNSLLPALVLVMVTSAYHFRARWRGLAAVIFIPMTLVFLLGTGQRGAFVIALALALVAAYFIAPRQIHRFATRIALVGVPLFFLTTIASGRANLALQKADGFGGQLGVLFEQLAFRLLGSNQSSSVVGFRYIDGLEISFGSEWAQSFIGLLPGVKGSDLSNRIFEILYGSTRGTSPLSLWGAAYHNFGFLGTFVFAMVISLLLCRISRAANSIKHGNLILLAGVAGVTITLGTWIADGPVSVLNKGLVVYIILWLWGASIAKKSDGFGDSFTYGKLHS